MIFSVTRLAGRMILPWRLPRQQGQNGETASASGRRGALEVRPRGPCEWRSLGGRGDTLLPRPVSTGARAGYRSLPRAEFPPVVRVALASFDSNFPRAIPLAASSSLTGAANCRIPNAASRGGGDHGPQGLRSRPEIPLIRIEIDVPINNGVVPRVDHVEAAKITSLPIAPRSAELPVLFG